MDMDAYLKYENLPEVDKTKSKWAPCLVITSGFLIMTISAITLGAIFGYTYCYIEHHCIKPGTHHRHSVNYQTINYHDSEEARYNRTLHGAWSGVLKKRVFPKIGGIWSSIRSKQEDPKNVTIGYSLLNDTVGSQAGQSDLNGTVRVNGTVMKN